MTQPQGDDAAPTPEPSASGPTGQPVVGTSRGWSPTARPGAAQPPTVAPPVSFEDPEVRSSGGGTAVITSRKVGSVPSGAAASDGRASWLTTGLVGLLAALLVVGTVLLVVRYQSARASDAARAQGGLASRDAARLISSYDYKTLAKDRAAGVGVTTGDFRKKYETSFDKVVVPAAKQVNAVVRADVIESSVTEASSSELTALLFLNQTTVTNLQGTTGPNISKSSVQMHMIKVGGKWLIDQLTLY